MTEADRYFIEGFLLKAFRRGPALERLNAVFRGLRATPPRPPFRWEEKYAFSADLRPEVYTYDESFLDILFENGIPSFLREVCGGDLVLAHLQLRHAFKGESYMDWHRDTHFYGGRIQGSIPPVHKIIFYPAEGGEPRLRLKISPGSQLRCFGNRWIDLLQARIGKVERVLSSDDAFLLFNTSILHAAAAERSPQGAYRLIYSFCAASQLGRFKEQSGLQEAYRRRLERVGTERPEAFPAAGR